MSTGRKIVLADGTEYPGGECGYSENHLWCYLPAHSSLSEVVANFTDKEKTKEITFAYGSEKKTYERFTSFCGFFIDLDGVVRVQLRKEVA